MRRNLCFIIIVSLSILLIAYGRVLASYGYEAPENAEGSKSLVLAALNLREGVFPWNMEKQDTHPMVAMQTPVQLNLDSTDAGDSTDGVAESESNPVPAAEGDDTTTTVTSSGDAGETETAANEGGGSDERNQLCWEALSFSDRDQRSEMRMAFEGKNTRRDAPVCQERRKGLPVRRLPSGTFPEYFLHQVLSLFRCTHRTACFSGSSQYVPHQRLN